MKKIIVILGIVLFAKCGPTCKDFIERDFRPKEYHFVILKKDFSTRNIIFYGKNEFGNLDTFSECGWVNLYEAANIGDSIKKQKGKTIIYLIKKDTVIEFPCYCGQERID